MYCSWAQDSLVRIHGYIIDSELRPISGAWISVQDEIQAQTDQDGFYSFETTIRLPLKVVVGSNDHSPEVFTIREEDLGTSSSLDLRQDFQLKTRLENIGTVEISTSRIQRIYNVPNLHVMDYRFIENDFLLLVKQRNNYELRLVDLFEKPLASLPLHFKPKELFTDCFGNKHVVSKDSLYQLHLSKNDIQLIYRYGLNQEEINQLLSCKGASKNWLYFSDYAHQNQSLIHFGIHRKNGASLFIHQTIDQEKIYSIKGYETGLEYSEKAVTGHHMGEITIRQLIAIKNVEQDQLFHQKILTAPAYHPLKFHNDSLYVFDHPSDSLFVYDQEGKSIRVVPITYHASKTFESDILLDDQLGEMYVRHSIKGRAALQKIDLFTGKAGTVSTLDQHILPTNIQIRNGYAYYLYNRKNNASLNRLYRQKIEF